MTQPGFLDYLEVHNFKSYRGTQRIGPFRRFSCIIGPNGSGKSNLVDAISFVLGVKTNNLRGSQLKDLIFREDGEKATVETAYVKLIYTIDDEEIEFCRTLNYSPSTNKTVTEYKINDEVVPFAAYNAKLESFQILVKAKNFFVFQGDVESVATKSPKALTELFEQISGSIELKKEYEDALAAKELAEENTRFNEKKKRGIDAEKQQFDKQRQEADKYGNLVKEKKKQVLEYTLWQLYHIQSELKRHQQVLDGHKKLLSDLQATRMKHNAKLQRKKTQQTAAQKSTLKATQQLRKEKREIDNFRPRVISLREEIGHVTKQIANLTSEIDKDERHQESHAATVQSLQEKLDEIDEEYRELEEEIENQMQEDVRLTPAQQQEFAAIKQRIAEGTTKERELLDQETRSQKLDEQERSSLVSKLEEFQARKAQLSERESQLDERLERVNELIESSSTKKTQLEKDLLKSQREVKKAEARKDTIVREIEKIQSDLRDRKADILESKRDTQMKELLKNLTRLFPSVRGRLIDLIEPRERFELAVTVTLGKNMDSIVVDDEKTAIECLQYMKEQHIGTATFLPLDSIKVAPTNEALRQIDSTFKLVIDVMKFDHVYKRAVQYATGNTLVVETIEDAKDVAYNRPRKGDFPRCKVVTMDGVLIRKSGLITGGISSSLESRSRGWDQKDLQQLKDKRDKLLTELSDLARTLRMKQKEDIIHTQIAGINTRLEFAEQDREFSEKKIKDIQDEIATLDKHMERLQPEIDELDERIESRQEIIQENERKIRKIEDKEFKSFGKQVGISDLHDYEEKHVRLAKANNEQKLNLTNQRSELQSRLDYEQGRNFASITEKKEALAKNKEKLDVLQQEYAKANAEIDRLQKTISEKEKAIDKEKAKVDSNDSEVAEIKKDIDKVVQKMTDIQKQSASSEAVMEQNRVRRHTIYQNCKVEEIWDLLPIESGDSDESESDSDMDVDSQEEYQKEDKIVINFSKLPKHLKQSDNHDRIMNQFKTELHNLTMKIDKIDPNLKALEHLKKVKERLGATKGQLIESRNSSTTAAERFEEIKNRRIEKFNEAYIPIAAEIDTIYKALTVGADPSKPGGTAYLNVDNDNEPYLGGVRYHVMPPNKRFRDMEQLSGGEKTVAALALLFATHSKNPAPFFLLDEVDAALDKVNIAKVARYLESRKHNLQFIVVSLQDQFYENADGLVGVMFDHARQCSGTLTLDLTEYDDTVIGR